MLKSGYDSVGGPTTESSDDLSLVWLQNNIILYIELSKFFLSQFDVLINGNC